MLITPAALTSTSTTGKPALYSQGAIRAGSAGSTVPMEARRSGTPGLVNAWALTSWARAMFHEACIRTKLDAGVWDNKRPDKNGMIWILYIMIKT